MCCDQINLPTGAELMTWLKEYQQAHLKAASTRKRKDLHVDFGNYSDVQHFLNTFTY
jgi:hypothetical protein